MRFRFSLIGLFLFGVIILPNLVFAVSPSSISVDVVPPNPNPFEIVTVTLNSFAANLDTVRIEWLVDGKSLSSGIGKKSFSLTAKAANIETRVEARIYLPDGQIDKKVTIRPAVMVLLWQANDSYVPPFYKGKALPSLGSEIKVVAIPEIRAGGTAINPRSMTYAWKKDYSNQPSDSGYGKNFFTYTNDYLEDRNIIGVTASTTDQIYQAEGNVGIGSFSPKIVFYKSDTELGTIWEKAIADIHRINEQEVLMAAPYFVSPRDVRHPSLFFNWFINGSLVNNSSYKKNVLPVKVEAGSSGTAQVRLEVENKDQIFKPSKKEIRVEF